MTLIVVGLAVFRITRLITEDTIGLPIRNWGKRSKGQPWWYEELVTCPWCIGFWVGLGATIVYAVNPEVAFWLSLPFAFSAVAGLLSND